MKDDEIEQMLRQLVAEHLLGERQRHAVRWIDDRQLLHSAMDDLDNLARTTSDQNLLRELYVAKNLTEDEVRYDQIVTAARLRGLSENDILIYTHKLADKPSP
jgi:hypothetical protein